MVGDFKGLVLPVVFHRVCPRYAFSTLVLQVETKLNSLSPVLCAKCPKIITKAIIPRTERQFFWKENLLYFSGGSAKALAQKQLL